MPFQRDVLRALGGRHRHELLLRVGTANGRDALPPGPGAGVSLLAQKNVKVIRIILDGDSCLLVT